MDEIKIKALIDAGESAKTVQELKKALRDLKSAAVEVGESSEYFQQITQAAGSVSDRIGDLNAQVKSLGDDLFALKGVAQIGQGIAAGFSIAQGAAAMFGDENKSLEQSLLKVNGAMALLNGVMAIGEILQKESTAMLVTQNVVRGITVGLVGKETVAKAQLAVANGEATVTQWLLNAAMTANPAGILIAAIGALVGVYYLFSSAAQEAADAEKALNDQLEYANTLRAERQKQAQTDAEYMRKLAESEGKNARQLLEMDKKILDERQKASEQNLKAETANIKKLQDSRMRLRMQGFDDTDEEIQNVQKQIDASIERKNAEVDNLRVMSNGMNKYQAEKQILENKVTLDEKKENEKRIKDNKKALDKKKDDLKAFVLDKEAIDKYMLQTDIKIQQAILDSWDETYNKKLLATSVAQEEENAAVYDSYMQLYDKLKTDFEKSKDYQLVIALDKANSKKSLEELFTIYQNSAIGAGSKVKNVLVEAEKTRNALILAQEQKFAETRRQLLEDELRRQKELYKESAKIVLSTDEYERFYQYIKGYTEQNIELRKKEAIEASAAAFKKAQQMKQEIATLEELLKKREEVRNKTKEEIEKLMNVSEKNADVMQKLEELNGVIEQTHKLDKETIEQGKEKVQLMGQYTEEWKNALAREKDIIGAMNSIGGGANQFQTQLEGFMLSVTGMTNELGEDLPSVAKDFGKTEEAMRNFGKVLDIVGDESLKTATTFGMSFEDMMKKVMDLNREVNSGSVSQSKQANILLASLYKDKNDQIIAYETDLNSRIEEKLSQRIAFTQQVIDADAKETDSAKKKSKEEVAALQMSIDQMKSLQGKKFSVAPTDPAKEFGLKALGDILPEEVNKLSQKLTDRYKSAVELETKYYEQSLFNAFEKYQKGEMTYEQYLKKQEDLKMNHEENMLVIDITYGNKSQEQLVDFANKRIAYEKSTREKEKAEKIKHAEELLALEKKAQEWLMQAIMQGIQKQDRISQQAYQDKIDLIDEEQKAYEDSIANRTAAEQQAEDIKAEFDLRRKQAEEQRRKEQNDNAEKQFEAQKYNSLAEIAIQYAVAIAKDWGTLGPFGAPMAVFHGIEAGLAAALVLSQKFVPQYADGGLVVGPGGPKDDKVNAKLSNGESVINAKSTKMFAPLLSAINQAGGGKPIPHLSQGGIYMPPEASVQNVAVVNSSPMISLDPSSVQAISNAVSGQTITIQENTISNAQAKVAKVESRTKF